MTQLDVLPIALRAYTVRTKKARKRPTRIMQYERPAHLLVFDCETRIDKAQQLTFGSARLYRTRTPLWQGAAGGWEWIAEWIFHDDELPEQDRKILKRYVENQSAGGVELRLCSRRTFVETVFWQWAYRAGALVVGFNLPFDLSRIAVDWGSSRGGRFSGGFSLTLWDYPDPKTGRPRPDAYRPRIRIKTIDSKRHLMAFGGRKKRDRGEVTTSGHFLDLRTLAFALTNRGYSLERACEDFGVEHPKQKVMEHGAIAPEYIDYNRRDVLATFELAEKLLAEYDRHPISPAHWRRRGEEPPAGTLPETQAYSPASIGKAYLRLMGITPVLARKMRLPKDLSRDAFLGYAMTAFYGGRAECRIRRENVPVVYVDYLSMYTTVNALMGLWRLLTAERVDVVDDTKRVRAFVEKVRLEDCFNSETWRALPVLVQVEPAGEPFPIRADYAGLGNEWQISVNRVSSSGSLWYALPDVLAAKLLDGRAPKIVRALRLKPRGKLSGLDPVSLRGEVEVDPAHEDFFRTVIEQRARVSRGGSRSDNAELGQFLKVLASSTGYGIFAEMQRRELNKGERESVGVFGLGELFESQTSAPEEPGEYCFPQ